MNTNDGQTACKQSKKTSNTVEDTPLDFMLLLYGWLPIVGHALGLYNIIVGRKKRGKFLLIYATVGFVGMIIFSILGQAGFLNG